ncbi:MAG: protein kinase domain-containing protein, partial [Verrucomicrobiales bacterium]
MEVLTSPDSPDDDGRDIEIFLNVPEGASPDELQAYLETACAGDAHLRARVDALLAQDLGTTGIADRVPNISPISENIESEGATIGPYKLLQKIGEGGFGDVYMAEQLRPVKRRVALKIIKLGMDTKQVVARFEAERQALALMDHPNIAKVHDAGATETGRPYFVMELVRGIPITKFCDEQNLDTSERLALFVDVCHAVQHAHQKGVIHRDLKPSNVMVTMHDDRPVVKVIDFGVAKATQTDLTDKTLFTQFEQFIGTPAYMSPEQAQFSGLDIDTRSDIYTLGVLLYELLTGTTPFDSKSLARAGQDEIRRIIKEEEPARPSARLSTLGNAELTSLAKHRQVQPTKLPGLVRGDLDWIVMKALEKDRTRRYETANALSADIGRYLCDEPVLAAAPSATYRVRKFVRRNRTFVVSAGTIAALLFVGVTVASWQWVRAAQNEGRALHNEEIANRNRDLLKEERDAAALNADRWIRMAYRANIGKAQSLVADGRLGDANAVLEECPAELRNWEWHWLDRIVDRGTTVAEGLEDLQGAWFSPDGSRIISRQAGGLHKVWSRRLDRWEAHCEIQTNGDSRARPAFTPDGNAVYLSGSGSIGQWDLSTGAILASWEGISARAFHVTPDRALAMVEPFRICDLADDGVRDACYLEKDSSGRTLRQARFSPDGRFVALTREGGDAIGRWKRGWTRIHVYDTATGKRVGDVQGVTHLFFDVDHSLVFGGNQGSLRRSDDLGRRLANVELEGPPRRTFAANRDGYSFISGGVNGGLSVHEVASGKVTSVIGGHRSPILSIDLSSDGHEVLSAGMDGTISVWRENHPALETFNLGERDTELRELAYSPDGTMLASAGLKDSMTVIWDSATGQEILTIRGSRLDGAVDFAPNGKQVVTGAGGEFPVQIWDMESHQSLRVLRGANKTFRLRYHPSGTQIVGAGGDRQIVVWNASTGKVDFRIGDVSQHLGQLTYSPDGSILAFADGYTGHIRLHDAETGEWLKTLKSPPTGLRAISFDPSGARLASGGNDRMVRIWDVESGELEQRIYGHRGAVFAVAFSRDSGGSRLFSGGRDGSLHIWDSISGEELLALPAGGVIWGIAVSPDGHTVATSGNDGTVRLWEAGPRSPEILDRRQLVARAQQLVDERIEAGNSITEASESLFSDAGIPPPLKKTAFEILQARQGVRSADFPVPGPLDAFAPKVAATVVPPDSVWKWLHPVDGIDPATNDPDFHETFFKVQFDDGTWQSGQ